MQYLMKGIQVCENERPYPLSMGDNEELKKKLKIFFIFILIWTTNLVAFE